MTGPPIGDRPGGAIAWALGAILALAAAAGIAWLSRAPYPLATDDGALLRLAWRARSETVEECRPLTEEERDELPVHMRRDEVCEGRVVPFRLVVEIDGAGVVADTIHGGGAHGDRPIYVFHEIGVRPGERQVMVRFAPLGPDRAGSEAAGRAPSDAVLRRMIRFGPGEVALVTRDDARGELELAPTGSRP